jgi:hypothetical protein
MDQQNDNKSMDGNKSPKKSNRSPPYALFNLVVILVAIGYAIYIKLYIKDAEIDQTVESVDQMDYKIPMFTAEELKQFNGEGECHYTYITFLTSENESKMCIFWVKKSSKLHNLLYL